jgi:hypothetical protein
MLAQLNRNHYRPGDDDNRENDRESASDSHEDWLERNDSTLTRPF